MKTLSLVALPLLALLAVRTADSHAADLTESDRARIGTEVEAFLASYLDVLEARDPDAVRELYVDDERFAWFTDGELRYDSVDSLLAGLAAMEGMVFSTESSEVRVTPLTHSLAHAGSSFQTSIRQGDRVVFEYGGVITWLLESGDDGTWRVLKGHTSTPKSR